jgi:hypothetical protein
VQRIVSTNLDGSSHENYEGIGTCTRLDIHRLDLVLDLSDTLEFGDDVLRSLMLLALEGHHGSGVLGRAEKRKAKGKVSIKGVQYNQ